MDAMPIDACPDASVDAGAADAVPIVLDLCPFTAPRDPGAGGVLLTDPAKRRR